MVAEQANERSQGHSKSQPRLGCMQDSRFGQAGPSPMHFEANIDYPGRSCVAHGQEALRGPLAERIMHVDNCCSFGPVNPAGSPEAHQACGGRAHTQCGNCWDDPAMGHTRLGDLPRTRDWKEVIGLIAAGAGADQIANAVIRAAENGLMAAAHHTGLVEAFWSLTQLTQAARERDFAAALRARGFDVPDDPSLPAILSAVSAAVDRSMPNNKGRTDLGEMAQSAAVEITNRVVTERVSSLFGATTDDVRRAFHDLGTEKNFGELGKRFFAQVMNKVLQFYVSRESANHVGQGQRFANLAAKAAFDEAMTTHCRQAAVIVEKFAGEWQSKQRWEKTDSGGITREDVSRFAHVAMKKIVAELKEGNK